MLLKVCGITEPGDARLAIEAGANALGFNFYPKSPRFLAPRQAAAIVRELDSKVRSVAIVVGSGAHEIPDEMDAVQIHGLDAQTQVPDLGRPIWVATSARAASRFPLFPVIIDSSWGTGKVADWEQVARLERDYILSGGLSPMNIVAAIQRLRPHGVDVCSGVESRPGKKDPQKLRAFLRLALDATGDDDHEIDKFFT